MSQLPSETSIFEWLVRGLGGIVTMLRGYREHGPRITVSQLSELRNLLDRLGNELHELSGRTIESGAEYHGPTGFERRTAGTAEVDEVANGTDSNAGDENSGGASSNNTTSSDNTASGGTDTDN